MSQNFQTGFLRKRPNTKKEGLHFVQKISLRGDKNFFFTCKQLRGWIALPPPPPAPIVITQIKITAKSGSNNVTSIFTQSLPLLHILQSYGTVMHLQLY